MPKPVKKETPVRALGVAREGALEYRWIVQMACEHFLDEEGQPAWEALEALPASQRVPALWEAYGLRNLHRLVLLMMEHALPVLKWNNTRLSVACCDLILRAREEELSLEDLIVFLESSSVRSHAELTAGMLDYCSRKKLWQGRAGHTGALIHLHERPPLA